MRTFRFSYFAFAGFFFGRSGAGEARARVKQP